MKKKYILDSKSIDKKISLALSSIFITLMGQYFILTSFNLIGTSKEVIIQLTSKVLVAIAFIYALPYVIKRSKAKFFIIYFVAIFILLINILIFSQNVMYIKELIFPILFMCIPSFIYSRSIIDIQIFKQTIDKCAFFILIMGTILTFMIFIGKISVGVYSMSLSYYMLFPAIVYINKLIEKINIINFTYLLISIISIISLGSRGALMCIGAFIILKLIRVKNKLEIRTITLYSVVALISIIYMIYSKNILLYLNKSLNSFGIESRTIELLMRDNIYVSGRDIIYNEIIKSLQSSPIIGIGIGGDRYISGTYAHNIFIEILCDFGFIVGLTIIIVLAYMILKAMITSTVSDYDVIIFWLSVGFIHLIVSSSYLIDIKFWILLGILARSFNNKSRIYA
ncbi:O-antigen polymerase [[Clostridium] sordellii]|uniref:O-antigen ligase family protein n=1 Tax=Paraclostridium sordellii TaxID=1505 RepID=UPI0005E0F5A4|nr:O-antigen ligase family protein [Paeniclostridium sordellii]QYE97352.1 O-antigen ligase family protein [Paeniclostridium sordellii]CEQ23919.1 O-antigen polymerase [[Clostridium] sordellii] [Paeniclostridium sordellii]